MVNEASQRVSLRDPVLRAILLLTVILQGFTWYGLEGYQLADSVEYMERAFAFVRAEDVVDSRVIRSFGFSALLTPFFAAARLLGLEDYTALVWLVRALQMVLGLSLVVLVAGIAQRLGGKTVALLSAFAVGTNPVFLQYSVTPLADIAGSVGVALAFRSALSTERGFRHGLVTGGWMGICLLMAYKTVPLCGVIVLLVLVRERRKAFANVGGILTSLTICTLLQALLDKVVYGTWAASLLGYFGENTVSIIATLCAKLHLDEWGKQLYGWYYGDIHIPDKLRGNMITIQPNDWYVVNLTQMLVIPMLVAVVLGTLRGLRRPNWTTSMMLAATGFFLLLLQQKGSKEFRLWLPLLPMLAPLAGLGLKMILGESGNLWRRGLVAALLVATVFLSVEAQSTRNTRVHSGYWEALDYIEDVVAAEREADPEQPKAKLVSSYHWAVFLRTSSDIQLTKLRHQIDGWVHLVEAKDRYYVYKQLEDHDWLIIHQPILTEPAHANLASAVNAWYDLEAAFWDPDYEGMGPVFVMRRRTGTEFNPDRRSLFDVERDVSQEEARALSKEMGFEEPVRMIKPAHGEELWMLGYSYETLPGDGFGWLTTWWYSATHCLADYTLATRLTTFDERADWQGNERPSWGVFPTDKWSPGTLVKDSRLVIAAKEPYKWEEPFRPMGGAYRRGDYMPAYLWIDIATHYWVCKACEVEYDPHLPKEERHICDGFLRVYPDAWEERVSGRLARARFGEAVPVRVGDAVGMLISPEGWIWSKDDLAQVGRFFLPVHHRSALADDGQPIPD